MSPEAIRPAGARGSVEREAVRVNWAILGCCQPQDSDDGPILPRPAGANRHLTSPRHPLFDWCTMTKATVTVRGIKITIPFRPEALPRDGVPMDGPLGDLEWEIVLEGGALRMSARLNGKNYRKALKAIDAGHGNVSVILQGSLQSMPESGSLVLDSAGFQVNVKAPKPEETSAAPPPPEAKPVEAPTEAPPVAREPAPPPPKQEARTGPAPLPGTALPGRRVYVPPAQVFRRRG